MFKINMGEVKVNQLEKMSTISLSQIHSHNKLTTEKRNKGFGQNYGDKTLRISPENVVDDSDLFDSFTVKNKNPE